jgi:nucleoside-diphosphate-sugar epimerase
MQILITGAETRLGKLAVEALKDRHSLRLVGSSPSGEVPPGCEAADLRDPERAAAVLSGMDAIAHLAPYHRPEVRTAADERELLEYVSRSTFTLCHQALKAGLGRIVLASRLDLLSGHPAHFRLDETWEAKPQTDAASLAPYMAELVLREFVRAEPLLGVALRFGNLGSGPEETPPADAVAALERALTMDLSTHAYRWWLYHVSSSDRFTTGHAASAPLSFQRAS